MADWDTYDTVFLGSPIWQQITTWLVNNFVKANASSGTGDSDTLLADLTGTRQEGQRFSSFTDDQTKSTHS